MRSIREGKDYEQLEEFKTYQALEDILRRSRKIAYENFPTIWNELFSKS